MDRNSRWQSELYRKDSSPVKDIKNYIIFATSTIEEERKMSIRQEKFAAQVQKDLGEIFLFHKNWAAGEFITISRVMVSPDLGVAKIYISMYMSKQRDKVMECIELYKREIRMELAKRIKNVVKKIPELIFYVDESQDYAEKIEKLFDDLAKDKPHSEKD